MAERRGVAPLVVTAVVAGILAAAVSVAHALLTVQTMLALRASPTVSTAQFDQMQQSFAVQAMLSASSFLPGALVTAAFAALFAALAIVVIRATRPRTLHSE